MLKLLHVLNWAPCCAPSCSIGTLPSIIFHCDQKVDTNKKGKGHLNALPVPEYFLDPDDHVTLTVNLGWWFWWHVSFWYTQQVGFSNQSWMMYLYPGLSSSYMVLCHLEWLLIVCSIFLLSITFQCLVLILSKGLYTLCILLITNIAGWCLVCWLAEQWDIKGWKGNEPFGRYNSKIYLSIMLLV